jgi:branched-chain amino acid aminotransferase
MRRVVYFNGEYVSEAEARVSIFDSALMFGDMAFEMTRTYGHRPFRLGEHLDRLCASLRLLEIDPGMTRGEMEQVTLETLARNLPTEPADMDWQLMHNVSRGTLGLYRTVLPGPAGPTITINCWPLITHMGSFAPTYDSGVHLVIPAQQTLPAHLLDPRAKTRSRLHYQMAQLQAARVRPAGPGPVWPILIDPDGFLAEGAGSNVFLVRDGTLLTPEPRNVLLGVSRAMVIELASGLGIPTREANLGRYDALQANELFCTATTFGLVHAASFEGQPVGDGAPGPVFSRLRDAWIRHVGVDFVEQARQYAERLPEWQQEQLSTAR